MKRAKFAWVAGMVAAITLTAMPAVAQEVWIYQAVSPNNVITFYPTPPADISYPADGSPARVISDDPSSRQEVLLTPQEEASRLQSTQIIINAVPPSLARSLSFRLSLPANASYLP